MIAILLFISFSIHVVLLMVTWKLVGQVKTFKNNQPEAIMDVFETYLEEVKEENRQLINNIASNSQLNEKHVDGERKESPNAKFETNASSPFNPTMVYPDEKINEQHPISDVALSFEANVLHLYSQGLSVEDIARKMNSGKTEVKLIVKFHNENKRNT